MDGKMNLKKNRFDIYAFLDTEELKFDLKHPLINM